MLQKVRLRLIRSQRHVGVVMPTKKNTRSIPNHTIGPKQSVYKFIITLHLRSPARSNTSEIPALIAGDIVDTTRVITRHVQVLHSL